MASKVKNYHEQYYMPIGDFSVYDPLIIYIPVTHITTVIIVNIFNVGHNLIVYNRVFFSSFV